MEIRVTSSLYQANTPLLLPQGAEISSAQFHGFSDASEDAYAGVVYLRKIDLVGDIHTSLVMSKTKVCRESEELTLSFIHIDIVSFIHSILVYCVRIDVIF